MPACDLSQTRPAVTTVHGELSMLIVATVWVLIMTVFVAAFFPETKGVPIECLEQVTPCLAQTRSLHNSDAPACSPCCS